MLFYNKGLPLMVAVCLPLISMQGHTSSHWYLGAKAGWINGSACEAQTTSCDGYTAGGSIFAGYQANDWLVLEAGYDDLGDIAAYYPASGNPAVSAHYKGEVQGFELVVKPLWQVSNEVTWFAKVGTLAWNMDVAGQDVSSGHNASDSGWSPLLGTGVEYAFNRNWSTLLEYQWINNVGGESTGGTNLNMVNVGMTYHFAVEDVPQPVPLPESSLAPVATKHKEPQWSFHGAPFASASSQLTSELQQALQPVIQRLRVYPQSSIIINTHTDSRGSFEFNQRLSNQRAGAVRDYMLRQGVAPAQVRGLGYGETQPIADNLTEAGRYQNRRVEVLSPEFEVTTEPE